MKQLKYKVLASALTGLTLVGCNDLDTIPLGSIITSDQKEETIKNDPAKVKASVTGITAMFSVYANAIPESFGHEDYGYPSIMLMLDSRGQDLVGLDVGYNWYSDQLTFDDIVYTNRRVRIIWATLYNQIYTANSVIKTIDPATEDSTLKYYLAQALAMRAFDYFTLAQLFQQTYIGNESKPCLPLITEENANEAATTGCPRSTVEETYALITGDLDKAIELLESTTVTREDKRYVSKEVAYGLRARVNLVKHKWSEAASDAQKAINGSGAPYSYDAVSKPTFNSSKDDAWMWGILIAETDRVVTSGIVNFPSQMGSLNYGYAEAGSPRKINIKLYNQINDTDARKGWWLDADKTSANLTPAQQAHMDSKDYPAYTQVKYAPYKDVLGQSTNASDIPLMRVEEMYLILAEAQAMSGNAAQGAATLEKFIQDYRDPQFVCKASTPEAVQDAVWLQRRIELWGEGLSYFDLLRLNKGVDRRGGGFEVAYVFNIPGGDPALIYRIPEKEIQANPLISEDDNNPVITKPTPVSDN